MYHHQLLGSSQMVGWEKVKVTFKDADGIERLKGESANGYYGGICADAMVSRLLSYVNLSLRRGLR